MAGGHGLPQSVQEGEERAAAVEPPPIVRRGLSRHETALVTSETHSGDVAASSPGTDEHEVRASAKQDGENATDTMITDRWSRRRGRGMTTTAGSRAMSPAATSTRDFWPQHVGHFHDFGCGLRRDQGALARLEPRRPSTTAAAGIGCAKATTFAETTAVTSAMTSATASAKASACDLRRGHEHGYGPDHGIGHDLGRGHRGHGIGHRCRP